MIAANITTEEEAGGPTQFSFNVKQAIDNLLLQ